LQLTLANQQLTEELKLQLGDRLPAAMTIAAKSMGMTMKEFSKAMESGSLSAEEFMPKFTEAMRQMAEPGLGKAFKSMMVAFNKMVSQGKLLVDAIFRSGVGELFTQIFNSLSDVFQIMQPIFSLLFSFASTFLKIVIFPIRLVIALIRDMTVMFDNWLKDSFGTGLNELMTGIGKVAAFISSIIGGIANTIGWILKGVAKVFGFTGTAQVGKSAFAALPKGTQETIQGYVAAGRAGAETAAKIGKGIAGSRYTKASAVGMGAQETGHYIYTNTTLELSGTAADALRENTRQSTTTAVPSNNRG